jgi:hypothetical protein
MQLWTDCWGTACQPTYRQGDTFSSSQFTVRSSPFPIVLVLVVVVVLETLRDVAPNSWTGVKCLCPVAIYRTYPVGIKGLSPGF